MYFTDDIKSQWSDNWDVTPADCSAEPPCSDENHHIRYLAMLPDMITDNGIMHRYAMQDIIGYRMVFFEQGNDEIRAGMTMKRVMNILGKNHVPYGELVMH